MDDDEAKPGVTPPTGEKFEPPWEHRGTDMSRVLALSDGIFAFAMTLLVLNLVLPSGESLSYFLTKGNFYGELYAYVLTFFVTGLWWQAHHLIFGYIRSYDRALLQWNTVFLILIAILPFATSVLGSGTGTSSANEDGVILFAAIQVFTGLALLAVWTHASGPSGLVPSHIPSDWTESLRIQMVTSPAVFAVSIPVAFVNPVWAEYVWLSLFFLVAIRRRRRRNQAKGSPPSDQPLASHGGPVAPAPR